MSIPVDASPTEIIEIFGQSDFVSQAAVDADISSRSAEGVESIRDASAQTAAKMNKFSYLLAKELDYALADLKRSERRHKYQTELLKSDADSFKAMQSEILQVASDAGREAQKSTVLDSITNLLTVKERMKQVQSLLEEASSFDEVAYTQKFNERLAAGDRPTALKMIARAEELATVWSGTKEEKSREKFVEKLRKRLGL